MPVAASFDCWVGEDVEVPFTVRNTDTGALGDPGTLSIIITREPNIAAATYTWDATNGFSSPNLFRTVSGAPAGDFTFIVDAAVAGTYTCEIVLTPPNKGSQVVTIHASRRR